MQDMPQGTRKIKEFFYRPEFVCYIRSVGGALCEIYWPKTYHLDGEHTVYHIEIYFYFVPRKMPNIDLLVHDEKSDRFGKLDNIQSSKINPNGQGIVITADVKLNIKGLERKPWTKQKN